MKKFDGVIFDMDGLLFDTELIYYTSTQKVADAMGLPYSKEVYLDYVGISDVFMHPMVMTQWKNLSAVLMMIPCKSFDLVTSL